jgi:transposase
VSRSSQDGSSYTALREDLDVLDATFACPDLTTFCRLDELGLEVTGQRLEPDRAVLACRVVDADPGSRWCRRCGCEGTTRDSVVRQLAHEPFGWRPTTLAVTVRRYRCASCRRVWRQDTTAAAEPNAKLSRSAVRWALEAIVIQHLTVARVADALAVAWDTANDAVLAEGKRVLIDNPGRFDGVTTIGVDEHAWRHTRRGDRYVTVIIDLTPIRNGTGPSRLLDMVEGRSTAVFSSWLAERDQAWRDGVEVVAMDGFTGFKTATSQELPDAVAVMDPFHTVRLAGDALDECRRRVQQDLHGHRGRTNDPLYRARRTLHTGHDLLTDKQNARLKALFVIEEHVEVEATWGIYQRIINAYRHPDRFRGGQLMRKVIDDLTHDVPTALTELRRLGRTLRQRAADVLAYFDRPGTSNGPTEAINGRLEHLRGSALGFRNLTNYIARSLLETGGFRPHLHPQIG